ncbi:MAG: hypothetical protein JXA89_08175 [Anaerolineae bacterium]|nr:hypothetical protein [Anaerolineae bacterium]
MIFAAWYGMIVGLGMIGQWTFFGATGRVPEFKTEPIRIAFHLAAELLTAIALIVGGSGLLAGASWGHRVYPVSIGMLLYTTVISPGYFAQKREWPMVGMFALLFALALLSLGLSFATF